MANNSTNLSFENKLWEMADKMRGHMNSGEYTQYIGTYGLGTMENLKE